MPTMHRLQIKKSDHSVEIEKILHTYFDCKNDNTDLHILSLSTFYLFKSCTQNSFVRKFK